MNHFDSFGISIQFYPDLKELAKKFKVHIMTNHPDLNDGEQSSEDTTAQINSAYKILKKEQKRIAYILQLVETNHDFKSNELDPMFLMEMMELNETLMESDDSSSILEQVQARDEKLWEEIREWGQKYDQDNISIEEAYRAIKALFLQSNYMRRILVNHSA